MANKVLVLRWPGSAYDSLGGLLELMARELAALGLEPVMFVAEGENWRQGMLQVLQHGDVAFVLTMSGIGLEILADDKLLWDVARIPIFNWNCDHPCYFPSRHMVRSSYVLHGYVFPDHARYSVGHLHANGVAYAAHLGIPPRSLFAEALANARNGRLIFTKSGRNPNDIEAEWRASLPPELSGLLFDAAEALKTSRVASVLPTLQRLAEPRGLFFDGASNLAMHLIRELDGYLRFRQANLVVRSLLDQPVDVFGAGWDHIEFEGRQARYGGSLSWSDMLTRLPDYAGCLSTNPLVDESAHDRVFFALAAGVAPISDDNAFLRAHMPALAPYRFEFEPASITAAAAAVLADPAAATQRAEETWAALAEPFGLRRAASQILQAVLSRDLNGRAGG